MTLYSIIALDDAGDPDHEDPKTRLPDITDLHRTVHDSRVEKTQAPYVSRPRVCDIEIPPRTVDSESDSVGERTSND